MAMSNPISCMLRYRQQRLHSMRAELNAETDLYSMESLVNQIASGRRIVAWHQANQNAQVKNFGYSDWNKREWLLSANSQELFKIK